MGERRELGLRIKEDLGIDEIVASYPLCGRLKKDLENISSAKICQQPLTTLNSLANAIKNYNREKFDPKLNGPEYSWNPKQKNNFKNKTIDFLIEQDFAMNKEELSKLPDYMLLGLSLFIGKNHFRESSYMIDLISTRFVPRY